MTENNDQISKSAALERFVLYWGDMGGSWGVNRSVAQIHALLYVSERPLHADEISERLGLARSNVSNSIKELTTWNLVRRVPVKGDRRDHFEAETDVVEMIRLIAAGRKERELDPAISALQRCVSEARDDQAIHPVALERLEAMLDLTEQVESFYAQMFNVPKDKLLAMMRLGARLIDFLPFAKKK
ncbi:MAG: MarR family transcriptional regulator [Pseudomonadota bacterium]